MAHSIQDSFNGWVAVYVVYEKYLSGLDASSFIYSFSVSPLFRDRSKEQSCGWGY